MVDPSPLSNSRDALRFLLAGNATFTLRSKVSGLRYTYRIKKLEQDPQPTFAGWGVAAKEHTYFVNLLTGPDNEGDFTYLGLIKDGAFRLTRKSRMTSTSLPVVAICYAITKLMQNATLSNLEIWHEGRCGRCGRKLTVPESISSGFGPECINYV